MSPPKIMFDDGSRVMEDYATEHSTAASDGSQPSSSSARGAVPLEVYYEIVRVAREVVGKLDWSESTSRGHLLRRISASVGVVSDGNEDKKGQAANTIAIEDDGFLCRVALQFPDELLSDAPDVSWLMETAVANAYKENFMGHLQITASSPLDNEIQSLIDQHLAQIPLLFIMGDTTYGSCCPDEVSANHLNANLIVHYGYACLSPTEAVPVVYAFGVSSMGTGGDGNEDGVWKECVNLVSNEVNQNANEEKLSEELEQKLSLEQSEQPSKKVLILYEVRYHHAMDALKLEFEKTEKFEIVLGTIPKQQLCVGKLNKKSKDVGGCGSGACGTGEGCDSDAKPTPAPSTCCASKDGSNEDAQMSESCSAKDSTSCCAEPKDNTSGDVSGTNIDENPTVQETAERKDIEKQYIPRTMGGLEIPDDLDLSQYSLLYIGDDLDIVSQEGNLMHILLRCGAPDGPTSLWSYSPMHHSLNTDVLNSPLSPTNSTTLSTVLSRTLRRRYFLLNKAKLATTIAILIGTTSNSYSFRRLLSRTRRRIQSSGRTAYTFAVGKLSTAPNKLTNFAEIDCFVLIACGDSNAKFWQMEREEMLVPVLTPLELDVALGVRDWDGRYSCDFGDLIRWDEADGIAADDEYCEDEDLNKLSNKNAEADDGDGDSSSDDEPFFSMISGKYEQSKSNTTKQNNDLEALPGQGKIIEYRSEAAEFLKQREYQGLEANVGETEAKAAVLGQVGIASNYGEDI